MLWEMLGELCLCCLAWGVALIVLRGGSFEG